MEEEKELIEEIIVPEFTIDGTNTYCLYDDKDQTTLIAMAYSEEQLKEETKYYSSGVWFEYDNVIDSNYILNERKYSKRVRFPKEPLKREMYGEEMENKYALNSKIGDIR